LLLACIREIWICLIFKTIISDLQSSPGKFMETLLEMLLGTYGVLKWKVARRSFPGLLKNITIVKD
jgi:hypothetical protein